jgi:transcriptional regulator with XRE-family HTH domain
MAGKRSAELKDRLRIALEKRNMKAVDLMDASGVPKSAISFYLAGKSKPKADRLYIMAKALNVSEAWLLGYEVPMDRSEESKKTDKLAELVLKMKNEDKFFKTVASMAALSAEQLDLIDKLVSGLTK